MNESSKKIIFPAVPSAVFQRKRGDLERGQMKSVLEGVQFTQSGAL